MIVSHIKATLATRRTCGDLIYERKEKKNKVSINQETKQDKCYSFTGASGCGVV